MKIKSDFLFSTVSGKHLVIPTGAKAAEFNGMITLNETGAFIWRQLEQNADEAQIVAAILENYDVEEARAVSCVKTFLEKLREVGCVE